jgi:hypothetical protein
MRRRVVGLPAVLAVVAAALVVTAAPGRGASTTLQFFRMPSKNIACLYSTGPTVLRCDILSGVRPRPSGSCQLDWAGYSARPTGRAFPTCAGDTAYSPRARILPYGSTWRRGGFTCSSKTAGLRCTNRSGHGFFLSRQRSYAF